MTSTYQKRILHSAVLLLVLIACARVSLPVYAQTEGGLSLSVTPTLFQMSAIPSQAWNSNVKVINNNPYSITVYAQVVNFAPQGETGEGKFLPVFEKSTEGTTLAEWITISSEPITIAPEQSHSFPFTVSVPENAAPGGHFAAILIGTKPPEASGIIKVTTSQIVTSLFFVRVAGDVTEDGVVREFRTTELFTDTPKADFEVRFENKGNVHLQPQGEIIITNMWGKERGIIPINHQTHFGNVLPQSVRKFEFSWTGEQSFSDIGRYKALLTLAYGEDGRKFVTTATYFYVIPVKATAMVLGTLIGLVLLIRWSIRLYVRRMLLLAGIDPELEAAAARSRSFVREGDVRVVRGASLRAPVRAGVTDYKERLQHAQRLFEKLRTTAQFIVAYKRFFASLVGVTALLCTLVFFVLQATQSTRDYEIVITNPDAAVSLSSEDIIYQKSQERGAEEEVGTELIQEQTFTLILVNSSDTPGAAAKLQATLEAEGYTVSDLQSDFSEPKQRSVVVYTPNVQEAAFDLSKKLGNALLSSDVATTSTQSTITVYIGNDGAQ